MAIPSVPPNNGSGTNYDTVLPSATTNWNHYAITKDGSTGILSVYQNGTLVASPNVGKTIAFTINALAHGYSVSVVNPSPSQG